MTFHRLYLLAFFFATLISVPAVAKADDCAKTDIVIDRSNSVHGLKEGGLFAYVDLAAAAPKLSCHTDADIQTMVSNAVGKTIKAWWKEERLADTTTAQVHIISILNKDEYARANINSALMHGKLEFTRVGDTITMLPATLVFNNMREGLSSNAKDTLNEGGHETLSFDVAPPLQQCARPEDKVVGMQSPVPEPDGKWTKRAAMAKKALLGAIKKEQIYTVNLKYTLASPAETKGMEIQDISIALPQAFHDNVEYELSCRTSDQSNLIFRKFSPKMHNQNYEEPPVNLLPRDCLSSSGEVTVRAADFRKLETLAKELKTSVFRAVLWDPNAKTVDTADLDLYLPSISYRPGARVTFHAHALNPALPATIELIHVGKEATLWKSIENVNLESQKISAYSFRDGLNWPVSAAIVLPKNIPLGYYVAVLRQNDKKTSFPFIVRPLAGNKASIAIIAATNTWQAYNGWGNGSFYETAIGLKCLATDYGRLISSKRPTTQPNPLADVQNYDHFLRVEKHIAAVLEENKFDYVVYSEYDLNADPSFLTDHAIVVLPSHPEYYTEKMYDAVESYAKGGGNILYLGGNGIYYKISMLGHQLEKHENGRLQDLDKTFGGYWSTHLDRSQAALLGNEYDARDYDTYAPYAVKMADHPVFAGTGLKNGDVFGADGSGHEMDIITDKSPANTVLLAKGTNPNGYGADMVITDHPGGGKIFSVGSISYGYAIAHDEKARTVVKNVINMMLEPEQNATRP